MILSTKRASAAQLISTLQWSTACMSAVMPCCCLQLVFQQQKILGAMWHWWCWAGLQHSPSAPAVRQWVFVWAPAVRQGAGSVYWSVRWSVQPSARKQITLAFEIRHWKNLRLIAHMVQQVFSNLLMIPSLQQLTVPRFDNGIMGGWQFSFLRYFPDKATCSLFALLTLLGSGFCITAKQGSYWSVTT